MCIIYKQIRKKTETKRLCIFETEIFVKNHEKKRGAHLCTVVILTLVFIALFVEF